MTNPGGSVDVYREYFADRLERFGESLHALDYGSRETQLRKFEALAKGILSRTKPFSLLDLGSGFGDFYRYLRAHRYRVRAYTGIDLVPGMVDVAAKRCPRARFLVSDVLRDGLPIDVDYSVACGIFYLKAPDSEEYLRRVVRLLWEHSRIGVLFSTRSHFANPEMRKEHHWHYDPAEVLRLCTQLTRRVVLRHDYMPHEFTVYMYREDGR